MPARREFSDNEHVYLRGRGVRCVYRVNCRVGETPRGTPVYSVTQLTARPGQYETFEAPASRLVPATMRDNA